MSALTVMIIRHAEKPEPGIPDQGAMKDGTPDPESLIPRGWQRAGAWASLFASGTIGSDYPRPDVIYAANPAQAAQPDVSKRPWETILPLCERLHIKPDIAYGVGDEAGLFGEVTKLTGVVLICWEHKKIISDIVPDIVNGQHITHLPTKWKGTRFDVVLRFDRAHDGAAWSFKQLFPMLMAGDSDVPLKDEE
jgi:hypothetical protein